MQQAEDIDIPTLIAISNFTGIWVSDYGKYLKIKRTNCSENNKEFVSSNLEFFGLIIYGILKIDGFTLKNVNDNDKDVIPWKCDPITKSIIKFELINNGYPQNWIFTIKLTSLFASNYIMTINANLIHTITKLPNVQNWKIIFKISKKLDFKAMIAQLFKSPLSQTFAQLIGNEIYQIYVKKFHNLWTLHLENINELTYDEHKIIKTFNETKKLLDSFESFKNPNSSRKLPFSLLTLRHIYFSFLCHLILQHLQFESFADNKNNSNNCSNNENDEDEHEEDIDMEEEEEKAMTIDDDKLYGNTPQYENSNDALYDSSAISNDVIATTITRCMRYHRPFDMNYKVILPNTNGRDIKHIKIRYISMEHCALIVVNDKQLLNCNLSSPKVKITLNNYISQAGDVKNLSGRHSLIKLLCQNIVRRAKDPLETTSPALGLMNSKIFSLNVLLILFSFLDWRDLLHFGYCSQLAYNISKDAGIWKLMYQREFAVGNASNALSVSNWKNKFLTQFIQQKSGTDRATQDLIQRLLVQ